MIPIETIKRLAIQCDFEGFAGTCMCSFDQLQAFANAIEAMTIDRCADEIMSKGVFLTDSSYEFKWATQVSSIISALKDT